MALGNQTSAEVSASGVALISLPTEFLDEGKVEVDADVGESESESEMNEDAGIGSEELKLGPPNASCACRGDADGRGGLLLALGLLGIMVRRRR